MKIQLYDFRSFSQPSAAFNEFREKLPDFTKYGNVVAWGFQPEEVFADGKQFRSRLQTMTEILTSEKEYGRLEKIEIGGIKGRSLGQRTETYFKEFRAEYEKKWISVKFDPLDLDTKRSLFDCQFEKYKLFCDTFERKLAAIFSKSFSESRNFEDAIKLIEMTGSLLLRPKIFEEIQPQMELVVDLYLRDIEFVEREFNRGIVAYNDQGLTTIPYDMSYPPVSGTLMWIKSLQAHVSEPIKDVEIVALP